MGIIMGIRAYLRLDKITVEPRQEFIDNAGLWLGELHWPLYADNCGCFGPTKITIHDVLEDWGNSLHLPHHTGNGHF